MSQSRREFFKSLAVVGGAALVLPSIVQAEEKRRAAKPAAGGAGAGGGDVNLPLVKPGEGMAASLNYQYKNTDVKDPALKVERGGLPFEKQHCNGCMLYTKVGMKDGAEVGKCTLFAGQLVKGEGWCASFAKKA